MLRLQKNQATIEAQTRPVALRLHCFNILLFSWQIYDIMKNFKQHLRLKPVSGCFYEKRAAKFTFFTISALEK